MENHTNTWNMQKHKPQTMFCRAQSTFLSDKQNTAENIKKRLLTI